MMKSLITACLLSLLLPLDASAKNRWYAVEVLIFENLDPAELQSESWASEPGSPDYTNTANHLGLDSPAAQVFGGESYSMSAADKLSTYYSSLRNMSHYRPIFHKAWIMPVQPLRVNENVQYDKIYLEVPGDSGFPKLEGTLEITLGRLLHIKSDWLYRKAMQVPMQTSFDSPLNSGQPLYSPQTQAIRIKTERGMRSRKLHYIDHPAVGMLVQFSPYRSSGNENSIEVDNPLNDLKKPATSQDTPLGQDN